METAVVMKSARCKNSPEGFAHWVTACLSAMLACLESSKPLTPHPSPPWNTFSHTTWQLFLIIVNKYGDNANGKYLQVIINHPPGTLMSEQVTTTAAVEEIAITVLVTICRVAHCAVCQRSQLDRVQVEILDSPVVGEAEVLGLDVAEVERGGEHRVQLLDKVQHGECHLETHI